MNGSGPPAGHDIRVAVVGCGYWGRNHVRNYAEIGALEAVVDRDAELAAEIGGRHGARALAFQQALTDPAIDALVFALPPSQNHALGLRALQAGKHLFIEKPIALETRHAQALCEAADRLDRRLMVGHILQYHPAFRRLAEMVANGELGAIRSITASRLNLGVIRREEDAWWALAPHDISMILTLMGAEPETVAASGGFHVQPSVADVVHADLGFSGGRRAHICASWLHPFKEQKLTLVGSAAMAVFDDTREWDSKLTLHPYRIAWQADVPVATRAEPVAVPVKEKEPLREECLAFLDSIRTGLAPPTDGREALRVLRVLESASQALARLRPS